MPRKAQGPRLVPIKRKGYGRSVYVIRYWDGERTRERSTGQEEIEAAEAVFEIWRAKRSGIHRTGPRHPAQRKIDDMLTTYAEERSPAVADADRILQIVSNLLDWWSDSNADAITEATCNAYVAHRLSQGRAIGTSLHIQRL